MLIKKKVRKNNHWNLNKLKIAKISTFIRKTFCKKSQHCFGGFSFVNEAEISGKSSLGDKNIARKFLDVC